jgi:PAS domain S-box-containing protein
VGVPAILLVRGQLDRLAWTLVAQASQTTQALLQARQSQLSNLAILTAQRPTLSDLVDGGDQGRLIAYLETLRGGAALDLVLLCGPDRQPIVGVSSPPSGRVPGTDAWAFACQPDRMVPIPDSRNYFYRSPPGSDPPGWLLAAEPFPSENSISVVVGQKLDAEFLGQLRAQTGLDQIFLLDGQVLVATVAFEPEVWEAGSAGASLTGNPPDETMVEGGFTSAGTFYYGARAHYNQTGLETIASLPVTGIAALQRGLTLTMSGGIAIVILLASALGYVLARRISRPLDRLRNSANALRRGNLETSIQADWQVREVAQVAYTLEDARIALRHSLEQLRLEKAWGEHLLESVVEGIITPDRQNRITFFSQGAERVTGLKKDQVLRRTIDEIFRVHGASDNFSHHLPEPGGKQEVVTVTAGSRPVSLAITRASLAPTEAGRASLALVLRDVTNEEAIRRLLGDFLANITHEFRTPLTAQAVSIELLLDELDDLDPGELRELLTAHYLGVMSLQTLIDNLLEGASIEAGRFRVSPEPMELPEVIAKASQTMQPLMEKYGLQLQVDLPDDLPLVRADARRTSQVLVNLLSNATKWSARGSTIRLSAGADELEVRISIADQGPGIPAEQKGELFTWLPNYQSKNPRAESGAGLGLSVVRTIVEAQGGRVGVEDGSDQGAVFWFTIPVLEKAIP